MNKFWLQTLVNMYKTLLRNCQTNHAKLILFRKQADSLNKQEHSECIKSFIEKSCISFNRDCTLQILFSQLHQEVNNNKMHNINKMNKIISKIVIARQSLDKLPSVLLSEITTYLSFNERIHFEQSTRSLFFGSNTSLLPVHSLNNDNFTSLMMFNDHNNLQNCATIISIRNN